jgi:hypothetical protein
VFLEPVQKEGQKESEKFTKVRVITMKTLEIFIPKTSVQRVNVCAH